MRQDQEVKGQEDKNQILEAIETISLKLIQEGDVAKIQQGLNLIHGLASHRNLALLQPEVEGFLKGFLSGRHEEQSRVFGSPFASPFAPPSSGYPGDLLE